MTRGRADLPAYSIWLIYVHIEIFSSTFISHFLVEKFVNTTNEEEIKISIGEIGILLNKLY